MNVKSKNIANSFWIDPDDAPELTATDFAKAQWLKGDTIISTEEGKAYFRQKLSSSVNTPLDQDIVEYFKTKSSQDGYIALINEVLRRVIELEQQTLVKS